jgi:two-component sensor histidine kinase
MCAKKEEILVGAAGEGPDRYLMREEIGKTRHDARKTIRLLSHMVDMLSIENCGKIIEDINRETTSLINILNAFRDTMSSLHEVNLKDLVLERIIPYVEASSVNCTIQLTLDTPSSIVLGYYVNFGRALINIVANSLEAIQETGRKGLLEIEMKETEEGITLTIQDNGAGIPQELLQKDESGIPAFVGNTTKDRREGEGLGTIQIYSTFGPENITVSSVQGEGTVWTIRLQKPSKGMDRWFVRLERRFNELKRLSDGPELRPESKRTEVIAYIWQLRKTEILLFDLILQFSKYQNIRTIYRTILSFLMGRIGEPAVRKEIGTYRSDHQQLKEWLLETVLEIRARLRRLEESVDIDDYKGALFKSYGQALENVIIFTMDPETGNFLATDRKLAEHLDLAAYLGKEKHLLLRGEFVGDMNNHNQPVSLGVWSVSSDEDLLDKLKLLRQGVKTLLKMGIHRNKKLSFYQTTYINHSRDIDSDAGTTFGAFAELPDEELLTFTRQADDELQGMLTMQD